jgi:hypothetical protein
MPPHIPKTAHSQLSKPLPTIFRNKFTPGLTEIYTAASDYSPPQGIYFLAKRFPENPFLKAGRVLNYTSS